MTAFAQQSVQPGGWRGRAADLALAGLVLGPLAAPFLQAWGLLIPRTIAGIIYTVGVFVCPQPTHGVAVYDVQTMAVCMRCYATVLGLLLTRLIYAADGGRSRYWLPRYQLRALLPFAVFIVCYPLELAGQVAGWWRFDNVIVTIAGLLTGVGLGLMFHPKLQHSDATV